MFDLHYLQQLISNGIEENPELEYKAAAALQRDDKKVMEITKDVSAFANSNGGIIIYGIREDQTNKHLPGAIDPVNRQVISKEWLEQILNAKIRPRIHGLKIHVVTITEGQVIYILEIPKGETAHQAEDKRYYRRHNFMVEPLFDHEIRDIMSRKKNPDIEIEFELVWKTGYRDAAWNTLNVYLLNVYANNIGKVYANYVNVLLTLPQSCTNLQNYNGRNQAIEQIHISNTVRDLVEPDGARYYQGPIVKAPHYGPARYEPVLPGMRVLLKAIPVNQYSSDDGNQINWIAFADNAESKSGTKQFSKILRN